MVLISATAKEMEALGGDLPPPPPSPLFKEAPTGGSYTVFQCLC